MNAKYCIFHRMRLELALVVVWAALGGVDASAADAAAKAPADVKVKAQASVGPHLSQETAAAVSQAVFERKNAQTQSAAGVARSRPKVRDVLMIPQSRVSVIPTNSTMPVMRRSFFIADPAREEARGCTLLSIRF